MAELTILHPTRAESHPNTHTPWATLIIPLCLKRAWQGGDRRLCQLVATVPPDETASSFRVRWGHSSWPDYQNMDAANPQPQRRSLTLCKVLSACIHTHTNTLTSLWPSAHPCLTLTSAAACVTDRERGRSTGLKGNRFIYWLMLVFPNECKSPRQPSVCSCT